MLTDDALGLALALLPPDVRARVSNLLAYGWPIEAERVLADYLGNAVRAKEIVAAMIRRQLTK